ncbi:menaquinone biosynthesis family protein [Candidatus Electronema sp. PJ]|uniref:menaquinone biosynthesis family protein n=1 Tax=Candidatus Electronema sp. PJ TaxID=3401572 RepID=UPI003AA8004A
MSQLLTSIGYSPCPNDTFIFSGLAQGKVPLHHIRFAPPQLEDVETLNSWAMQRQGRLDVTKLSFHALGHVSDLYTLLESGAALGRGCGPLLVTARAQGDPAHWRIAIPGQYTTAALLLRLFLPKHRQTVVMRFDQIMNAVALGQVDAGVIIHESRFTYKERGLFCVQDLGVWWEQETDLPLPLGCIAARTSLGLEVIQEIEQAIVESIHWASTHREECLTYIRQHAQEMDAQVLASHINLYVNEFSLQLGEEGRAAVQELLRRGRKAGVFAHA